MRQGIRIREQEAASGFPQLVAGFGYRARNPRLPPKAYELRDISLWTSSQSFMVSGLLIP